MSAWLSVLIDAVSLVPVTNQDQNKIVSPVRSLVFISELFTIRHRHPDSVCVLTISHCKWPVNNIPVYISGCSLLPKWEKISITFWPSLREVSKRSYCRFSSANICRKIQNVFYIVQCQTLVRTLSFLSEILINNLLIVGFLNSWLYVKK